MTEKLRTGLITGTLESIWLLGGFSLLKRLATDTPMASLRAVTGLFGLMILFVGILYGMKRMMPEAGGERPYLKLVKTGVVISLTVACMVSLFSLVFVTLINPGFSDDMVREAERSIQSSGVSPAEVAARLERARAEFSTVSLVVAPLILQPVMGTLFCLVLALFFRSGKRA
jgi:hypothetical protein